MTRQEFVTDAFQQSEGKERSPVATGAGFSVALQTARDQAVQVAGVPADTVIDLVGRIGRAVLENLMPDRRLRVSPPRCQAPTLPLRV
ncbi:hypothetical protein ACFZDK_52345 [Streptomyces sp. NPDC007901]|uniref:hypothetical protein n=1 Tax=Streptomyces sp. NPDC007901 TaxID=3364785 RepID=UPI0036EB9B7A